MEGVFHPPLFRNKNMIKLSQKCLIALPLVLACFGAHAESVKVGSSQSKDAKLEALTAHQQYDITHSNQLYTLFRLDQSFNISDHYVDQVVGRAKELTEKEFVQLFNEMKLTKEQKKELNKYIKEQRKQNGFDLGARANLLVRMDNAAAQNELLARGKKIPEKPKDFREFDVNDYFKIKFNAYMMAIDQVIKHEMDNAEYAELVQQASILTNQSILNIVAEAPFKEKLKKLLISVIQERELTDTEKASLVFWSDIIKHFAIDHQVS